MPEEYVLAWDKIADKYAQDKITCNVPDEHSEIFRDYLEDGSTLDVGCAHGKHLAYLASKGFRAIGLDVSIGMLREANKMLKSQNIDSSIIQASATHLPFKENSFDNVICMGNSVGAIPGKENRANAIKEMIRATKKVAIFELLKSDTTEEVKTRYRFSDKDEEYLAKRWDEKEISELITSLNLNITYEIKKGRKSVLEKYLFYLIITKKGQE